MRATRAMPRRAARVRAGWLAGVACAAVLAGVAAAAPRAGVTLDAEATSRLDAALRAVEREAGIEAAVVIGAGGEPAPAVGLVIEVITEPPRIVVRGGGGEAPLPPETLRRIEALASHAVADGGDAVAAVVTALDHVRAAARGEALPAAPPGAGAAPPDALAPPVAAVAPAPPAGDPGARRRLLRTLGAGVVLGALAWAICRGRRLGAAHARAVAAAAVVVAGVTAVALWLPPGWRGAGLVVVAGGGLLGVVVARGLRATLVGGLVVAAAVAGLFAALAVIYDAHDPATATYFARSVALVALIAVVGSVGLFAGYATSMIVVAVAGAIEVAIRRVPMHRSRIFAGATWFGLEVVDALLGARGAHREWKS